MAILTTDTKQITVNDGDSIIFACEQLGIPFGCKDGSCGTCLVKVISGMENLSPKAPAEQAEIPLAADQRLACQCKLMKGTVKIKGEFRF